MTSPTETLILRAADYLREPLLWALPEAASGLKNFSALAAFHTFRPDFLALRRLGIAVQKDWPAAAPQCVALTLPRQLEWACGLLAMALQTLPEGGTLAAIARNDQGGRRYVTLLEEVFEADFSDSKNHCRLIALKRPHKLPPIVQKWQDAYAPQIVPGTSLCAMPGTFSWDKVDAGSALLAQHLPKLEGHVADFGAGWGYLSHHVLQNSPKAKIDAYEADAVALAMAERNLTGSNIRFFWHDLPAEPCAQQYDAIVMNPPFHSLRDTDVDLGRGFILAAAEALKAGGSLWMVANRHLPYEEILAKNFKGWQKVADAPGFKVLTATR